jgi:hypothetical protein
MRILRSITIVSFGAVVILVVLSVPSHSLIPDYLIADLAFVFVPLFFAGAFFGFTLDVYRKGMSHVLKRKTKE